MKKIFVSCSLIVLVVACVIAQEKKTPSKAALERGSEIYISTCIACHQSNGEGVPGLNPPLVKTSHVLGDKTKLIQIMLKGMDEAVVINDITYTTPMPSFEQLTDQQIADVLNYVRNSFGNKAAVISVGQIKAERLKLLN